MFKKFLFIFASTLFFLSLSEPAYAAKVPRCTDPQPVTPPVITNTTSGNGSITLNWTEGQEPLTHYLLAFGFSKDALIYGAQNIGVKGTTSYTVDHLTNGTRYYFRVYAVNNCRLKASHTVTAVAGQSNRVSQQGSNTPRLSFYKPVLSATTSPHVENIKKPVSAAPVTTSKVKCTNACYGWQLLTLEIMGLLLFFFLAYKYSAIKPIFALLIPVFLSLLFYKLNYNCTSEDFFCKYFYVLNIVLFILFISFQRQQLMHKTMEGSKI